MNPERELRTIVIDGKLPVAEIARQIAEAHGTSAGIAIDFSHAVSGEKDGLLAELDKLMIRDDPSIPNEAHWIIPVTEERRFLTLGVRAEMGNRQARRAAAAQRRGKR